MSLYMDVRKVLSATAKEIADAHCKDLATQDRYGVRYLRYWVSEDEGKVFCLVDAPNAQAAATVHQVAHGSVANDIYQVEEVV